MLIEEVGTAMVPVGVRGVKIDRGEEGVLGGVFVGDIATAANESGLHESLRRQASLQ
jgi:hypothetical protein